MLKVLHIMPHLGGGVGKALSTLAAATDAARVRHGFILLEQPEKSDFLARIQALGCQVAIQPSRAEAERLLASADIVQLEWWNHPATFRFLCERQLPAMRLLIWCHVSGLHTPLIPAGLVEASDRFVLSSACSREAGTIATLGEAARAKLRVVSSGVGLIPAPGERPRTDAPLRSGYIGTLNFSKLHPDYVAFLAAADNPSLETVVWADDVNRELLLDQARAAGRPDLLAFRGYTRNVAAALAELDVFPYLLNPLHYGTAENTLLEAMSAGVVPIVLDNPAELSIVRHGHNGLVVDSPGAFAEAITWLSRHRDQLQALARKARQSIAETYTPARMGAGMQAEYDRLAETPRRQIDFRPCLGQTPLDWFMACQRPDSVETPQESFARFTNLERTKGSIQHFLSYFPEDAGLRALAGLAVPR